MKERIKPQCPNGHGLMSPSMRPNGRFAMYGLLEYVQNEQKGYLPAETFFGVAVWQCAHCDAIQLTDYPL